MHSAPALICVMGVSASGKTTLGRELAHALGVAFIDADDLHPEVNLAKMSAGIPLDDEDRWPWLDLVGAEFAIAEGDGLVIACSALRGAYRDRIRAASPAVRFVLLDGSPDVLGARAAARAGHFMPPALLASQLQTLERLGAAEDGIVLDIGHDPATLVARAMAWLTIDEEL